VVGHNVVRCDMVNNPLKCYSFLNFEIAWCLSEVKSLPYLHSNGCESHLQLARCVVSVDVEAFELELKELMISKER
jgi:hypothetical protein